MSSTRARYLFRGTIGQSVLLVTVALLTAQGIGFFLIVNERDRWRLLDAIQPAVEQFVAIAREIDRTPRSQQMTALFRMNRPDQHFILTKVSAVDIFRMSREPELERKLAEACARLRLRVKAVQASSVGLASSPPGRRFFLPRDAPISIGAHPALLGPSGPFLGMPRLPFDGVSPRSLGLQDVNRQEIDLSAQLDDGTWLNGQFLSIRPTSQYMWRLALAELILFAVVLAVTLSLAMRLARPMLQLANTSESMAPDQAPTLVPERGPPDIRAAIRSFNAMTKRVTGLLREKDQMLGALGHDLRGPLASLRIRAEAIEPAAERKKTIETLEDLSHMIDEILDFARLGYSEEQFTLVDVSALADAVVEEFREIARDVTFEDSPRAVVRVQVALLKRLLRNLIENGLKFGTQVRVRVEPGEESIEMCVSDDGPGIPDNEMERMFEPFTRLEASRNRETGGVGLGLAIARTIARAQRAELTLENAPAGGLIARVKWPSRTS